jgi:hypothetical protein
MKSKATMTVTVLTISILSMALFAYSIDSQQAFAKPPGACDPWPECNKDGGEDPPPDPPSSDATIELIDCDGNGDADKWGSDITYRVINRSGEKQSTIDAVITGVEEWNAIKGQNIPDSPYSLNQVAASDNTAEITIEVFKKITPGYILGFAQVCDPSNGLRVGQKVDISLGIKGLSIDGIKNLAAHEVGHGLGLGHTLDNNDDLMAPSLDAKERKNLICPSNLNVEAFSETSLTYMVIDWETLIC